MGDFLLKKRELVPKNSWWFSNQNLNPESSSLQTPKSSLKEENFEEDLSYLFPYMMVPESEQDNYIFGEHQSRAPEKISETEIQTMIQDNPFFNEFAIR